MGCLVPLPGESDPKPQNLQLPPQEKIIINHQKTLPFSTLNSRQIIRSIKAETINQTLNRKQLKRAFHDLQIPIDTLKNPQHPFFKILKQLENQTKFFNLKQLSVLAILLGQGGVQEKARWLFRQYDRDAKGMLDQVQISNLVTDLTWMSIEIIPIIAKGDQPDCLNEIQYASYIGKLQSYKDMLKEKAVSELLVEEEISQVLFVQKMMESESDIAHLLWAFGVRALIYNLIEL